MKIEDFLAPDDVVVGLRAANKAQLLQDLAERAGARLGLCAATVLQALQRREQLGSTGVGHGIAMPHARMDDVAKPFALLARLKKPIDFEAIDGAPVDLVFLLLQPSATQSDLNALAAVARKLRELDRVARLREALDAPALYRDLVS